MKLKHKDLLCIHDLSTEEVLLILDVAKKLKKMQKLGVPHEFCKGKTLAMMFSKASTRTRVSFETGFHQLGGHAIYLNDRDSQIGRGEPIRDTARVLSRMVDGIMIRTFSHDSVIELAEFASIPVINGLTDLLHPCQALTDLLTIEEQLGSLKDRKLVYVGDGNNMAHSLMYACAKVGMDMVCASPKGYQPDPMVLKQAQEDAAQTGCTISVEEDIAKAVKGADVLYTDVWTSMGQEAEREIPGRGDYGRSAGRTAVLCVGSGGKPSAYTESHYGAAYERCGPVMHIVSAQAASGFFSISKCNSTRCNA